MKTEELPDRLRLLESRIHEEIRFFEKETGLAVFEIDIVRASSGTADVATGVTARVFLKRG